MLNSGFSAWAAQLDFSGLIRMAVYLLAVLTCIILHEVGHGLAALALGDKTALRAGRLTLNPLKHIDIVGLVMLATVHFGWAKPVPVDMRHFKRPKLGMAVTALAGPAVNFLLAFLALLIYCAMYFSGSSSALADYILLYVQRTAVLSIGLGVFNLVPVPPLDGSKILFSLLPDRIYRIVLRYERYGFLVLILFSVSGIGSTAIDTVISFVLQHFLNAAVSIVSLFI